MGLSGRLPQSDRPGLITWSVDDLTQRDNLTLVDQGIQINADDIGRICRVGTTSPYDYYELVDVNPLAWSAISGLSKAEADDAYEPKLKHSTTTTDPTVNDDADAGYSVRSSWINTSSGEIFRALDVTPGAAQWSNTSLTLDDLGSAATFDTGPGNGLDADTVDGMQAADFATSAQGGSADSAVQSVGGTAPVTSTGGQTPDIGIDDATPTASGAMSGSDKTKLDGVESNATADQTGAEIKSAYEGEPDTNAYPDADKQKVGYLAVTQQVDLDNLESRVNNLDAAVVLKGEWDASSGAFPSGASRGQTYIVGTGGTVDGVAFDANDRLLAITDSPATGTFADNWFKLDYTDQVLTVAGRTGNITLSAADIGGLGVLATFDMSGGADGQYVASDGNGGAELRDVPESGIEEAPQDGSGYERKDGAWSEALFQSQDSGHIFSVNRASIASNLNKDDSALYVGGELWCFRDEDSKPYNRFLFGETTQGGNYGGLFYDNFSGSFSVFSASAGTIESQRTGSVYLGSDGRVGILKSAPTAELEVAGAIKTGRYTVATLPSSPGEGAQAYATDGRKSGEAAGSGTGVPVYYSGGWKAFGTDQTVEA